MGVQRIMQKLNPRRKQYSTKTKTKITNGHVAGQGAIKVSPFR